MTNKFINIKTGIIAGVVGAAGLTAWFAMGRGSDDMKEVPFIAVQKGNIQINVLQGGEIRALQNYEVKSEIELPTKILGLIPEGYRITEDDIKNGKVLIELDSNDIKDKITTHEIEFQTTVSAFIDTDEARAIQTSDNQSLARDAEQAMRFALMDFSRYMGSAAAEGVMKTRLLPHSLESLETYVGKLNESTSRLSKLISSAQNGAEKNTTDPVAAAEEKDPLVALQQPISVMENDREAPRIDFLSYLSSDRLGDGEAQQKLRQLDDEVLLHQSELALARQNYEASERLAAKDFITKTTLENDKVNLEKSTLAVKTAETQLDLFKKYEFPKAAEQSLSAYEEALKKLQRTLRANRSRMAQVESRYRTAKRRYEMELERKEDLERQLKNCIIKAVEPGLVAYGSHSANSSAYKTETVEEGAAVRFRQTLLTIPNMSRMGVGVSIHESQVKKVRIGQPCRITVDAEPGKTLEGTVAELAVLPDSASSRYTPNLKVYPAVVHIAGAYEWLKPGMNAKVEIIVNQLDDILYVPVQSIEVENDHHFTYVNAGNRMERREVETGSFNNEFIEIKSGLNLGEKVALALPKKQNMESNPAAVHTTENSPLKDKEKSKIKDGSNKKGLAALK